MRRYAKTLAAIAAALGVTATDLASSAPGSAANLTPVIVAWLGVLGVYGIPNTARTPDLD
jgi:hypothetical protein